MQLDSIRRWRLSLFAFTFIVGLGIASWVTRTPAIRDAVEASTAGMGLVLFGLSVGSMVGVVASGRLVSRIGSRSVIAAGAVLVVAGMATVAGGTAAGAAPLVFTGLLLFGTGGGLGEVALNIDGAEVERLLDRPVLPALHGSFSLGTLVGALAGIGLTAAAFPASWHLVLSAVAMAALGVWAIRRIPAGTGRALRFTDPAAKTADGGTATRSVWRDPAVLLLGAVVLAVAFAEGSANDWLPLLMVDGLSLSPAQGSMVFAAFAAVMTVGRFAGQPLVTRFGKRRILLVSVVVAAAGVLLVSLSALTALVVLGVVLWGLGASLGFPVAISAAGDSPDRPAERVSAVATSGYLAFLVGPPVLGFLGEHYGLRGAILVVAALLAIAAVLLLVRSRRRGQPSAPGAGRGSVERRVM
jgi:MFS family permease